MGQYWICCNLDKKEYVVPHELGCGLKLWEQLANHPSTGTALIILCAAMPETRGGGDFDLESNWHGPERDEEMASGKIDGCTPATMPKEYQEIARVTIGRWAGDRIAFVGDYAEETDLPAKDEADRIYARCHDVTEMKKWSVSLLIDIDEAKREGKPEEDIFELEGQYEDVTKDIINAWTNITPLVCAVIEHELGGKFVGDGWKHFEYPKRKEA